MAEPWVASWGAITFEVPAATAAYDALVAADGETVGSGILDVSVRVGLLVGSWVVPKLDPWLGLSASTSTGGSTSWGRGGWFPAFPTSSLVTSSGGISRLTIADAATVNLLEFPEDNQRQLD